MKNDALEYRLNFSFILIDPVLNISFHSLGPEEIIVIFVVVVITLLAASDFHFANLQSG